jgi:hypothetical protein
MNDILQDERFNFISGDDKAFMLAFNNEMAGLGYDFGSKIVSGFCWGKYMVIFTKSGAKSNKVYARIYIRDSSIVLRLFFTDIDAHREFIENAPSYIKEVFTGEHGACNHCKNEKAGNCKFRKTYTLSGRFIEKCNGITFEFHEPGVQKISDYMALFTEFYPQKKTGV